MKQGILFALSGPSAVGKTTLTHCLLDRFGQALSVQKVITYTTRLPRPGESPGVDYHFLTMVEFRQLEQEGFFIEVVEAYGAWYAVGSDIITTLNRGTSLIAVVNIEGGLALARAYQPTIGIWIDPPTDAILRERMIKRGAGSGSEMTHRLAKAAQESACAHKELFYKYNVVNDDLDAACERLAVIISKEKEKN